MCSYCGGPIAHYHLHFIPQFPVVSFIPPDINLKNIYIYKQNPIIAKTDYKTFWADHDLIPINAKFHTIDQRYLNKKKVNVGSMPKQTCTRFKPMSAHHPSQITL